MIVYSTCRDCGSMMQVTCYGQTVHPGCVERPTEVESLAQAWLAIAATDGDVRVLDELERQIEVVDAAPPNLGGAALWYASLGWPVFPLLPGTKRPATVNGFKDATTDRDVIAAWWTEQPAANIGLPTGVVFDVVDIDLPDGVATLFEFEGDDSKVVHGYVTTASGGSHLYIRAANRGNMTRWRPGVDYRGLGGYVVAPPSWLGAPGTSWSWRYPPSPVLTGVGDTLGATHGL